MMFELAEMLIGGDAKTRWDDEKLRETEKIVETPENEEEEVRMISIIGVDTYQDTRRTFLKSYLDKHSANRQKQYMRNYIHKHRKLKIKMYSARLRELNGY